MERGVFLASSSTIEQAIYRSIIIVCRNLRSTRREKTRLKPAQLRSIKKKKSNKSNEKKKFSFLSLLQNSPKTTKIQQNKHTLQNTRSNVGKPRKLTERIEAHAPRKRLVPAGPRRRLHEVHAGVPQVHAAGAERERNELPPAGQELPALPDGPPADGLRRVVALGPAGGRPQQHRPCQQHQQQQVAAEAARERCYKLYHTKKLSRNSRRRPWVTRPSGPGRPGPSFLF